MEHGQAARIQSRPDGEHDRLSERHTESDDHGHDVDGQDDFVEDDGGHVEHQKVGVAEPEPEYRPEPVRPPIVMEEAAVAANGCTS